jgi:hypothetical protein
MSRKRRSFSGAFKAKVALAAYWGRIAPIIGSIATNNAEPAHLKGSRHSALVRTAKARERLHFFRGKVAELRQAGMTYDQVAEILNAQSFTTPRGKQFTKSTICKILR